MECIQRKSDIVLGNEDLENVFVLKQFPCFMGCVDASQPIENDQHEDMIFEISQSSGMIQLGKLLPLEIVYQTAHGSGSVGELWKRHHQQFAKFVLEQEIHCVLEIGGGHGILSRHCLETKPTLDWNIIDINPEVIHDHDKIHIIQKYFDEEFTMDKEIDSIIHSHVMEHMYDIHQFLRKQHSILKENGLLIFSVPNLKKIIEQKYVGLHFEHTIYLTEEYIEYFLSTNGFELKETRYFEIDHSIFYCAIKSRDVTPKKLPCGLYTRHKVLFHDYFQYYVKEVEQLNETLSSISNASIYLFGAHVFSQYLISLGLHVSLVKCIIDNDKKKHHKRLYGTNLIVHPATILEKQNDAFVIVRAGVYTDEIKQSLLRINGAICFL